MNENDVRILLQRAINDAGSQRRFALDNDVDPGCISNILQGYVHPTPQVLRALKVRRIVTYEKEDEQANASRE